MKITPHRLVQFTASGVAALGTIGSAQATTLLQFTNQGANGSDPAIAPSYGSNVAASDTDNGIIASVGVAGYLGTPNITLTYTSSIAGAGLFDSYPGWDSRGDVLQTDYLSTDNILSLAFNPVSGFGVLINSFDLDEFTGGGASAVDWSITNNGTTIVSGTWNDFESEDGGRSTVITGMTPIQAELNGNSTLLLNLNLTGGASSYQALDNLSFDQVNAIPEAGTAILCLAGLGAGAMRRRRK